jgi:hypothetical protein
MEGLRKRPTSVKLNQAALQAALPRAMFRLEDVRRFAAELEVPFSPSLIEWRVMSKSEDGTRGKVAPYADPRAYTDRLNQIFTPAGWTRRYAVTTSANFERAEDNKLVAKVFVTCDLSIHGLGSHSATGEEWTDNHNAGTSAEAQAFKRACACFGLGRYLYNFTDIWVDIDEHQRPREAPQLFGWATPEGWRAGLRPTELSGSGPANGSTSTPRPAETGALIQQIEGMAETLGKNLYRGILKSLARVWKPADIRNRQSLMKVFSTMELAQRELGRLKIAQEKLSQEEIKAVLSQIKIKSIGHIDSLDSLRQLVQALENAAPAE